MLWLAVLTIVVMIAAAVLTVLLRSYLAAIAAVSVVSLALAVLFVILRAPDVALAEAAVAAGLSGVLLALTARRVGLWRTGGDADKK
ncbi:MAG: hydrogenase subunit MbhD domain-containing protein [Hyphomicrobiales bacterium]